MKMFSSCRGSCYTCSCSGMCLAGHGDDDYSPASKEQIVERINQELDIIETIGNKKTKEIKSDDLSSLRHIKLKLKVYCEALAKGSW